MKILILSHYFPPEVNAPAKRIFEHSKIFNELNNEIVVITNFPNHPKGKIFDGYKNKWLSKSIVEGIKVIRVYTYLTPNKGIFKRSFNYFLFMILSAFHGLKEKNVDIIISTSPQLLCGIAGMILSKIKKIPHVFEIRDIWPSSIAAVGIIKKNNLGYRFLNFIEKKIIYSAQIVAVVTDGIFSYVKKYRKENVILVTNGVMTDNFNYKKTKINNNQLTFGYVGTIGKAHNTKIILEAAKYFEDEKRINFKIIGDGAEKETIFNQAMQIKNITTKGLLLSNEIINEYDQIDVGLVTLKNDKLWSTALPTKIFEFLIQGKPVILSIPNGKTTQMIIKNKCGLVSKVDDASSLIESINFYLKNPQLILSHGENGIKLISSKFNREKIAKNYLDQIIKLTKN